MTARCVMVLGTTSGAGKSWLATALCRWYANQGLKVAPFKAQNMSNNARVAAAGEDQGEIGSAQYFQALAARAAPDVRMNPLLLKPEADTHSQVVLLGKVDEALTRLSWRERSARVWPPIAAALDALRAQNDVVVIEGAGSPAEINLMDSDIVNLRVARHAQARCLLVTDIDRGGAFAHLYGTWALLPPEDRERIRGFVLNKFRGDPALLAPAPQQLEDMTGIPTVAVLPMWREHGLPEEDGVFDDRAMGIGQAAKTIAIVAYPRLSNLDEFQSLKSLPGVRLVWSRDPKELEGLNADDWIVLPGSKHTSGDLAWLRAQGLDEAVLRHADRGGAVLGVCGGLQMLGAEMTDPHGIDGEAQGLGLLSLSTVFAADKVVSRCETRFGELTGRWAGLSGLPLRGYEIHHGRTRFVAGVAQADAREVIPGLAWQNAAGNVLGLYVHGLFEEPAALQALLSGTTHDADAVFDGLAQFLERHVDSDLLYALIS
ncbi:MAG: cobyric acid synthase [Bordetella sp.]|uniref:cobyric acid synthase n=1 Tax=Bordetella sp. TaxID=28081 RepID=UPI003F7C3DAE